MSELLATERYLRSRASGREAGMRGAVSCSRRKRSKCCLKCSTNSASGRKVIRSWLDLASLFDFRRSHLGGVAELVEANEATIPESI